MMNLTTLLLSFWDYALESTTRILNMVPTKKVDKTPYELWIPKGNNGLCFYLPPENKIVVARYPKFFEKNLITQEVSGRAVDLEEIQDGDTSPFKITSEIPMEAREHSLGDLNEPAGYKAAMLDSKSNQWIDAVNAEIQSMIDNMICVLVDLPPSCKTIGSFVDPNHPRKVCKLQRSIYGLKQASKSKNKRFDEEIKKFGFAQNLDEP
nr:hypothetical protein [Tanacetum cinerariifolium]